MKNLFAIIISVFMLSSLALSQPIIDSKNMDLSVKPGDDFFSYANGTWVKNTPIPPDLTRYGAFDELRENNSRQLQTLIEEISAQQNLVKGSNKQKIGDFFSSGMDEAKINSLGYEPIKKKLDELRSIKSKDELIKYMAFLHSAGSPSFFGFGSTADKKNSSMNIASLRQSGITLPNKDYYLKDDDRTKSIRAELQKYMVTLFKLVGYDDKIAEAKAQSEMDFEVTLAKSSFSNLELRDPDLNYNKMTLDDLAILSVGFDWKLYFKEIGVDNPGDINVGQKRFFEEFGATFQNTDIEVLKTYVEWRLVNAASNFLSEDFVNANFEFNGKFMSGAQEQRPRWKRVLDVVNGSLGEALGELYVEKYFPPASKQRIKDLVANIKVALVERIKNLSWMSAETKKQALNKLDKIAVKVGYPDKWEDYSKIDITRDSYWDNLLAVRKFNYKKNLSEIGKPVDRTEWGMSPQTVNAYYSPNNNEICFPAGILQPPFFFAEGDDAVNYGGIGAVIGHEITHGFDDQGRKYDAVGNLQDWWTAEDGKNFEAKAQVLVDQYNNFAVLDTFKVDGKFTLGENIADLGGVTLSLEGLKKAWEKNPPKKEIEGFTPIQRFFLSYAQIWRGNIRDKELLKRLKEDVHSPSTARVNCIVYNIPEFYTAFGITSGKMFKEQGSRAVIW
ncbi:MAG: M13 family metallopeptidase [Ignavibacteriota bacterium]|nr:M13 family metallopeptidase [Ignavibacteriota bacterium]